MEPHNDLKTDVLVAGNLTGNVTLAADGAGPQERRDILMMKVATGGVLISWQPGTAVIDGVGIIMSSVPNYPQTVPRAEAFGPLAVLQGLHLIPVGKGLG